LTLDNAIPVDLRKKIIEWSTATKQVQIQPQEKRNKRIALICGQYCFLLTIVTAYFIATKGFDYVRDNLIGHPTKELLESEWVKKVSMVILA
jgi:hypothetical protein